MSRAKSALGQTPPQASLHSYHHLGTQQTCLVIITATFSGALPLVGAKHGAKDLQALPSSVHGSPEGEAGQGLSSPFYRRGN